MEPHEDDDFLEADDFEVFTIEELLAEDEIIEELLAEEFKAAETTQIHASQRYFVEIPLSKLGQHIGS
uniref:Uncharacterized protein n=1 Tax=Oryza barthii TaxID=65489 RepID=A0A0D3H4X7_9ORYZ